MESRAAEHHGAAVDAEAQAARGGQTVFQSHDVVLIHHVSLVVARWPRFVDLTP